jgi:hypothetical protein
MHAHSVAGVGHRGVCRPEPVRRVQCTSIVIGDHQWQGHVAQNKCRMGENNCRIAANKCRIGAGDLRRETTDSVNNQRDGLTLTE